MPRPKQREQRVKLPAWRRAMIWICLLPWNAIIAWAGAVLIAIALAVGWWQDLGMYWWRRWQ
jgi:hypothetical protein